VRTTQSAVATSFKSRASDYEAATDTFVVQNGKIVGQSFAAKITPKQ
jgi:hypothetical protein